MNATLAELAVEASTCTLCALSKGRTAVVFGSGDPDANLMFIGEAPGMHEDRRGIPFVGAAGQLLDELLDGVGLSRDEVYVANILKCRPPKNRDPLPEEIQTCTPYLRAQIDLVDPRVICTLGNFATQFLLGHKVGITRVRGTRQEYPGRIMIPTFHPAAVLHGGGRNSQQFQLMQQDFNLLRLAVEEATTHGTEDAESISDVEQLDLF